MDAVMKKHVLIALCAIVACALLLTGCTSQSPNQSEPQYADEAFIASLAKGYEARDTLVNQSPNAEKSVEYYEKIVDAELSQVEQYQTAQFQDSKLQENAIAYINALKDQHAAAGLYETDKDKCTQDWQKAYDKRTELLRLFVDDYGLTVSGPHQDSLNDLVSHGKKVTRENDERAAVESLAASIVPEFTEQYSTYTGKATVTNNTGYDFDTISFKVELFDESNVKVETTGMYASHWLNGETIVLDCYTSVQEPPATVKVVADYYQVAENN